MALRRYNTEAPVKVPLVDQARVVTLRWLQWFTSVGDAIQAVSVLSTSYDPPNLAAGAAVTVNVTYDGATPGDFVRAVSFSPMAVGGVPTSAIRVLGDVTAAGQVSVTFFNVSGGAVDLDAGTLRIQLERQA